MQNNLRFWGVLVMLAVCEPACELTFNLGPNDFGGADHGLENVGERIPPAADAGTPLLDARAGDASLAADAALAADAPAMAAPDAGADARLVRLGDGSVPDLAGEGVPTDVVATVLSPSQCWGRHLGATHEFMRYARLGLSVWHLCYHTALWDALVPGADPRPAHVTFFRYDPVAHFPIQFAQAEAPSAANPWTANVMVAMPPGASFAPFFNLGNVREGGAEPDIIWAVQPNTPDGPLALNGVLQIWRVNADGSQTLTRPQLLCQDPLCSATETRDFLVPETACAGSIPSAAACGLTSSVCSLLPLP